MDKFSLLAALGVLALFAVARAMPQSGSDASSEDTVEAREIIMQPPETQRTMKESTGRRSFMGEVRAMCRNTTGSDDAYIALTEAIGTTVVCVITWVDVKNFMSDVNKISNETRGTFFPKYCPQLKRAGSCLDDLVKALSPCLQKHSLTNALALTGMYPGAVDLVCKNDGEIMFTLAEPNTKECVFELWSNVRECTVPFHMESEDWDISNLTETQMGAFYKLRQCIEDKLNECEAPDLISVYDLFHNRLLRLDSCYNIHPFIVNTFVPFVQAMSTMTEHETNKVDEN